MFDTILLNFPIEQVTIMDRDRFSPSARGFIGFPPILMGSRKTIKAVCNPTKAESEKAYYPTLTLFKSLRQGGYKVYLHVQFSAQKLLYGNNFDEIGDDELDDVCQMLHLRLKQMGVLIDAVNIRNAQVTGIHYAKNIPLTDHTIPYDYIRKFGQIDQSLWRDTAKVDYRNGGYSFKLHTNTWELTIYDKRKDLQQAKRSERKAISKQNHLQLNLLEQIPETVFFEVLRIELRLNTAKTIRQHLERTGLLSADVVPNLTLSALFDELVAKTLLLHYLRRLEDSYPTVHKHDHTQATNLLTDLRINNAEMPLQTLLAGVTFSKLLDELGDMREIRSVLGPKAVKQWSVLKSKLSKLKTDNAEIPVFDLLTRCIIIGDKLRIKDYFLADKKKPKISGKTM
jgi:hypothetical protein